MKDPSDSTPDSGDVDTLLQRIRGAVKERSGAVAAAAAVDGDGAAFDQFEAALREQTRVTDSVLAWLESIASDVRDLQEHATRAEERRARQSDYVATQLRDLRDQVAQFSGASARIEEQIEAITERVFEIEPNVDASIAQVRAKLQSSFRETIASELGALRESLGAEISTAGEAAEKRWAALAAEREELALSQAAELKAAEERLAKLEAEFSQTHALLAEQTEQLRNVSARLDSEKTETAKLIAQVSAATSASLAQSDTRLSSVEERIEADARENRTQAEAQFSQMNALLAAQAEEVRNLSDRMDSVSAEAANMIAQERAATSATVAQNNARLSRVEERIEASAREIQAHVEGQLGQMNAQLDEQTEELRDVRTRLGSAAVEAADRIAEAHAATTLSIAEHEARLSGVDERIEASAREIQAQVEARLAAIQQSVEARATALEERLHAFQAQTMHDLGEAGARLMTIFNDQESFARKEELGEKIGRVHSGIEDRLQRLKAELTEQLSQAPAGSTAAAAPARAQRVALKYNVPKEDFDYFTFEERWRGSVDEIAARQAQYLELFRDRRNVLDLGCGRGEFVKLLLDNGINVRGIDGNADMVSFCVERGLPVAEADIFDYLEALSSASLDAITLFQVLEHLRPERYISLIALCAEKLEPGGLFVAETVNPNCPLALSNFFLDPTHVRPLPAATLVFICRQHGFDVEFTRYSSPVAGAEVHGILDVRGDASIDLSVYQDYALIARNGARTPPADSTEVA